jgi:hypothetical protein
MRNFSETPPQRHPVKKTHTVAWIVNSVDIDVVFNHSSFKWWNLLFLDALVHSILALDSDAFTSSAHINLYARIHALLQIQRQQQRQQARAQLRLRRQAKYRGRISRDSMFFSWFFHFLRWNYFLIIHPLICNPYGLIIQRNQTLFLGTSTTSPTTSTSKPWQLENIF